jgi:molecular chaperone GrpE
MNAKDPKNTQNTDDIVYEEETAKKNKTSSKGDSLSTDEVVPEEVEESLELLVKSLREKLKTCEKEKQEYMDGWQRERADFSNYKKRIENEKLELVKYANESLVEDLVPVLDSFEMAYANREAWEKVDKNWRVGVEYIHTHLIKVLKENGIEEMNPVGEKFDPALHVAEEIEKVEDKSKDGIIIFVKKKGYSLNGRVILAPKVIVGELK